MRVSQAARAMSRFSLLTRSSRSAFVGLKATKARVVPFHRDTSLRELRAGDGAVIFPYDKLELVVDARCE